MGIKKQFKKQEASPRWAPFNVRGWRKLWKGGRKRRAQEDATEIWYGSSGSSDGRVRYIFHFIVSLARRAEEGEREREIRSTLAITPASDLIISPRRSGELLLDDIILTAAPPMHVSLAHFSRRATERARERRLSCPRDNGFPGNRGSTRRSVHPTGQSRPRVNEFSPWMKPRRPLRPITHLLRWSENSHTTRSCFSRVFLIWFFCDLGTRLPMKDSELESNWDRGMSDKFDVVTRTLYEDYMEYMCYSTKIQMEQDFFFINKFK